ncbi:competence protein, ComEC family [Campylobacter iguaniorum]|uniref:ComEC/Rec2 family competence protein n=1 Tax=Campylobacter iguaniorum TaxID=1244531 RepID=UPI0007C969BB|nr:ComEC/Rec2 family competence protein [Campylobacter iguaniorum]ANE36087.1 competence protein, ComEC family [Campylobacter iguaniorum]
MKIFENTRQIAIFVAVCLCIFSLNLAFEYYKFSKFTSKDYAFLDAKVLQNYQKTKNDKSYFVLKLRADDFEFYTTSKKEIQANYLKIGVITKQVKFKDYIKGVFYMPNFKIENLQKEPNLKDKLQNFITSQHQSPKLKELYSALYLATPISKDLRGDVTSWGIAHIIAISGFHLGIIFGVMFFIIKFAYARLSDRFFPYRNINFEISLFIFICLGFYLWILDFTPSFLRSYVMGVVGFVLVSFGLKVFRIENLLLCVILSMVFVPNLVFSIGFYFSCLGVFFIFLYIHHFGDKKDLKSPKMMILHGLMLEIFVFSAMNLPVFYFFSPAGLFQLSVIPLGYVFVLFYPLSVFLHIFGIGGIFDEFMLKFIQYADTSTQISTPFWLFVAFNLALPLAYKFKLVAVLVGLAGAILFFGGLAT